MATILVVDDELGIRALLSEILSDEGHSVEVAENAAQARALREQCKPDLVLLDIWMPDVDGITLLKEWSASGQLTMPVIMMSGHGTIDTAVEATKFGAQAFLEKPITMQKLLRAVEQGLSKPAPRQAAAAPQTTMQPMHLATVTPITAASSYNAGYNATGGAAPHAAPHHAQLNGHMGHGMVRTELAGHGVAAELNGHAPVVGNGLYGHAAAPSHHGMNGHHNGMSGPSHEQLFQLDRPLREARDDFERAYFEFHLAREGGSMTRVAEKTGLERTHLYRKLKQLGVDLGRNKKTAAN
ncbi:response regulator [Aquabacterium sp.]|uniref:response regulator n=1 Tax=Aquabacterium sp. TaxID=1872578 RepID=UPI0035C712B2